MLPSHGELPIGPLAGIPMSTVFKGAGVSDAFFGEINTVLRCIPLCPFYVDCAIGVR